MTQCGAGALRGGAQTNVGKSSHGPGKIGPKIGPEIGPKIGPKIGNPKTVIILMIFTNVLSKWAGNTSNG